MEQQKHQLKQWQEKWIAEDCLNDKQNEEERWWKQKKKKTGTDIILFLKKLSQILVALFKKKNHLSNIKFLQISKRKKKGGKKIRLRNEKGNPNICIENFTANKKRSDDHRQQQYWIPSH